MNIADLVFDDLSNSAFTRQQNIVLIRINIKRFCVTIDNNRVIFTDIACTGNIWNPDVIGGVLIWL